MNDSQRFLSPKTGRVSKTSIVVHVLKQYGDVGGKLVLQEAVKVLQELPADLKQDVTAFSTSDYQNGKMVWKQRGSKRTDFQPVPLFKMVRKPERTKKYKGFQPLKRERVLEQVMASKPLEGYSTFEELRTARSFLKSLGDDLERAKVILELVAPVA